MAIEVIKGELKDILPLRILFLQENNFQIRYNACHERGWTDSYIILIDGQKIGYGSVKGNENLSDRDTVFEFYIIPSFRKQSSNAFLKLLIISRVKFIECQTNDRLLTHLLYQYGHNISSDTILFEENCTTEMSPDNIIFRDRNDTDTVFEHKAEPIGQYVIESDNRIVATGGFLLHYNMPFADLYMEVKEDERRKGIGSFLIQELKKQCYLAGRVPAARTGTDNMASKNTLMKAGLKIAGCMLLGQVKQKEE